MWCDPQRQLYFVNCPRFLNQVRPDEVPAHYGALLRGDGGRQPYDVFDFLVHEQHFWRGYSHFQADNMARCLAAAEWAASAGLAPVSFGPGIAGNTFAC
jgi:hypothetical protein